MQSNSLAEHLEKEIATLLTSHQIYDIGNYGWLNENTPDPEFLGHAMWQIEPPLEFEHDSAFGEAPVCHRPTEYEEVLTISGADFEGLMRLAYRSIGLTLWQKPLAENAPFSENHYFWLHYVNAMFLLNIASDRLREFFIMAHFQKATKKYEKADREHRLFQTPFTQAKSHADPSIGELLAKLTLFIGADVRRTASREPNRFEG